MKRSTPWAVVGAIVLIVVGLSAAFWIGYSAATRMTTTAEPEAPADNDRSTIPSPIVKREPKVRPVLKPLPNPITIDSKLPRESAAGVGRFPAEFVNQMDVVAVQYFGFDGQIHQGQIVIHHDLASDIREIFKVLLKAKWPVEKVIPIVEYNWNDQTSINDNNTSAFNYRKTIGPGVGNRISMHAFGRAVDLNPFLNPFLDAKGRGPRPYDPTVRGTIDRNSVPYLAFRQRGWTWGGDWAGGKDYQHFEKGERTLNPKRPSR